MVRVNVIGVGLGLTNLLDIGQPVAIIVVLSIIYAIII